MKTGLIAERHIRIEGDYGINKQMKKKQNTQNKLAYKHLSQLPIYKLQVSIH